MEPSEPARNGADLADVRILIIDDDNINAMLAKSVLERLGCTIQISSNPVKALEKYARDKDTIDLVLVDYFMPTMDGGATVDHLRKLNPEIKVLLFRVRTKCGCGKSSVSIPSRATFINLCGKKKRGRSSARFSRHDPSRSPVPDPPGDPGKQEHPHAFFLVEMRRRQIHPTTQSPDQSGLPD